MCEYFVRLPCEVRMASMLVITNTTKMTTQKYTLCLKVCHPRCVVSNTMYIIMCIFTYTCSQKHDKLSDGITV